MRSRAPFYAAERELPIDRGRTRVKRPNGGNSGRRVAVVDRTGSFHAFARDALSGEGYDVVRGQSSGGGVRSLVGAEVALVDVCVSHRRLLHAAEAVIRARNGVPTLVITGCPIMDAAARVLYPEAEGFLQKPCTAAELMEAIQGVLAKGERRSEAARVPPDEPCHGIVGRSSGMRRVIERIHTVSSTDATVLLTGETGTGKELVARAIHACSARSAGPFVVVDTLALSESLLESELFGHERGAFTGAVEGREGLFEAADGGTIFLDEIGDVAASVQVRLLRAIQELEVRRVGAVEPRSVDVRIVAASQRPLEEAVEDGRMRADLYYRLNVYRIDLPPLRSRPEDVPALVEHYLAQQPGRPEGVRGCTELAMRMLRAYDWPGNVRELRSVLEAALIGADVGRITARNLPERLRGAWRKAALGSDGCAECTAITDALDETDGHRSDAAELLGVSRTTLWRWMKKLDL